MRITLKHGIDFPRAGGIALDSAAAPPVASIALYADDYGSLRARPAVAVGDRVLAGMPVMRDRRHPEVALISPVTGRVREVRMGPRRSLQAVVVATDGAAPEALSVEASAADEAAIENIPRGQLRERLLASGLWAALRERPGDRVPPPDGHADAVLVRAMDTEPLAPDPLPLLGPAWQAFRAGLVALSRFAKHRVWVCTARRLEWPTADLPAKVRQAVFGGPHPAGLPGTHISRLTPLSPGRTAWHVDCQDVIAAGALLLTGRLPLRRAIAISGPHPHAARWVWAPPGARIRDLLRGAERDAEWIISGSPLAGRSARKPFEHLGRFHRQVTVLGGPSGPSPPEAPWWSRLGLHAAKPGPALGMVPDAGLEQAWALDVPVAPLLRALMVGDLDTAVALGCLDLGEEDLALCTLLCPGGHDYGAYLREALTRLREELAA